MYLITDELLQKHRKIIQEHFKGKILDYAIGIKYAYCVVQEEDQKSNGISLYVISRHPPLWSVG